MKRSGFFLHKGLEVQTATYPRTAIYPATNMNKLSDEGTLLITVWQC